MGKLTTAQLRRRLLELGMDEADMGELTTRKELEEAYEELSKDEPGAEPDPEAAGKDPKAEAEGEWVPEVDSKVQFQDDEENDVFGTITSIEVNDDEDIVSIKVDDDEGYEWDLEPGDVSPVEEEGEGEPEEEPAGGEPEEAGEEPVELEVGMEVECADPDDGDIVRATITDINEDEGTVEVEDEEYAWVVNSEDVKPDGEAEPEEEPEESSKTKKKAKTKPSAEDGAAGRYPRDPELKPNIEKLLKQKKKASQIACILMNVPEDKPAQARKKDFSRYNSLYHRVYAVRAEMVKEKEQKKRAEQKKAKAKEKPKAKVKVKAKAKKKVKAKVKRARR